MDNIPSAKSHELEQRFVKNTYDDIAEDFSSTRYKNWPKVDLFLKSLKPSSLLLDVGCGNGKYLGNSSTVNIGCDISLNLLAICKKRGYEVVLCDMTRLPFRDEAFDCMISVASLHHVVTTERRQKCIDDMARLLSHQGKLMIQVWSFEQNLGGRNPYLKKRSQLNKEEPSRVIKFDSIQLAVHKNRTPFKDQDVLVPFSKKLPPTSPDISSNLEPQLRYYHVFREKELDSMLNNANSLSLIDSYYDCGNWCSIAEKSTNQT